MLFRSLLFYGEPLARKGILFGAKSRERFSVRWDAYVIKGGDGRRVA